MKRHESCECRRGRVELAHIVNNGAVIKVCASAIVSSRLRVTLDVHLCLHVSGSGLVHFEHAGQTLLD